MFHVPSHKNVTAPAAQLRAPDKTLADYVARVQAIEGNRTFERVRVISRCPACGGTDHTSPTSARCPCSAASGM